MIFYFTYYFIYKEIIDEDVNIVFQFFLKRQSEYAVKPLI